MTTSLKHTILVVEDEQGPRDALRVILRPFYNLHLVDNRSDALRALKEHRIDLVTLDLKLPDRQGMDLLQEIKLERSEVEVIIITGYGSLKSAMDGIRYGAAGYLLKPFNVRELIALIDQTMQKKQRIDGLRDFLRAYATPWGEEGQDAATAWNRLVEQYRLLSPGIPKPALETSCYTDWAPLLSDLLEAKDRQLLNHSTRVSFYSTLLAKRMNLSVSEQKALSIGAFLHDIGKIVLEAPLLSAASKLNERDRELVRRHPEIGARMVGPLQVSTEVKQIISYHHEQYDGSGYPHGLHGEGIPLLARIVGLTQAFDHLVAGHHAQPALTLEGACEKLRRQAGSCFDPALTDLFVRTIDENKSSLPALAMTARPVVLPES